jgi:hypothetical protein
VKDAADFYLKMGEMFMWMGVFFFACSLVGLILGNVPVVAWMMALSAAWMAVAGIFFLLRKLRRS